MEEEEEDYGFRASTCPVCGRDAYPEGGVCYYCGTPLEPHELRTSGVDQTRGAGLGCFIPLGVLALIALLIWLILRF